MGSDLGNSHLFSNFISSLKYPFRAFLLYLWRNDRENDHKRGSERDETRKTVQHFFVL